MKIKLIVFDAYGVTLTGGFPITMKYISERFDKDIKKVREIIYNKYFNMAAEKKISQEEAWKKPLEELGIKMDWKELRDIHYSKMGLNKKMIEFIAEIGKQTNTLLLTKNTKEQFDDVNKKLNFTKYFKNVINTFDLNLPKASKETWNYIFKKFDVKPEEIIYIDDREDNLAPAKELKVNTIFYEDFNQFKKEFYELYDESLIEKSKKYDLFLFSSRQRMSPFPNYFSMECISKEMKEALGDAYNIITWMFKENVLYGCFDKKDYERVSSHGLKKVLEDPKFFHKIVEFVNKHGNEFIRWVKEITEKDVSKYSNKELAKVYKGYEKRYKYIYSRYFTILAVEKWFTDYLKDYLRKRISDENLVDEYFNILITEPRAQVSGRENYAALKLAEKILKNEKWKDYLIEESEEAVRNDKELNELFEEHEKGYFWITRDYEDPVLTYSDFVKRIKKMLEDNPLEKLKRKKEFLESVDKRIRDVEEKIGMDKEHSELFKAMREGLHLKELRKTYVSKSLYYFDPIIKEMAKRSNVSLNEIRHLRTDEAEMIFTDKELQKELKERIKLCVFWAENGKSRTYTGKQAEDFFNKTCVSDEDVDEIKGLPAAPGKAIGKVRIIMNPDEMNKVKQGEIIVTFQIVPSFAPVMSRAAGLVCDGGTGITSHPSTLSREAGIPCVVSAKIALQLLKDGDLIEVDGSKGIVKRIKK